MNNSCSSKDKVLKPPFFKGGYQVLLNVVYEKDRKRKAFRTRLTDKCLKVKSGEIEKDKHAFFCHTETGCFRIPLTRIKMLLDAGGNVLWRPQS
jgi:hypothetical protein